MASYEVASAIHESLVIGAGIPRQRCGGGAGDGSAGIRGRVVQIDPMKPVLKAPGPMLSKLRYYGPLSNFAFSLNLRRYTVGAVAVGAGAVAAGAYTRSRQSSI